MSSAYRLTYFDLKARAENIRYLFVLAGVEFEDVRIDLKKDWAAQKANFPYGQLPVFEFGGNQYPQSQAIWRYVAREFGYYGGSSEDALKIDVVCELANDLWPFFFKVWVAEKDEKPGLREEFEKGKADEVTGYLEQMLKKNNDGNGWFVGEKISLADVVVFNMIYDILPWFLGVKEGEYDLKDKEALKAFVERFKSNKRIADWIKKRPVSDLFF